ncbi:hypothetical protein FOA52_005136 [Chlamydomonas sp. UWO 241]|nr:hypothetical protein FOA52_005136 [Chlamydomonas sp. UWO 241]
MAPNHGPVRGGGLVAEPGGAVNEAADQAEETHTQSVQASLKGWAVPVFSEATAVSLEEVDLGYCAGLSDISALSACPQLRTLQMSGSRVTELALQGCVQLKVLHMDNCPVCNLGSIDGCTQLDDIHMNGTKVRTWLL